jgi:hypothetical protein
MSKRADELDPDYDYANESEAERKARFIRIAEQDADDLLASLAAGRPLPDGMAFVQLDVGALPPANPLAMTLSRRTWAIDCLQITIGRGKSAYQSSPRIVEGPSTPDESDEEAEGRLIARAKELSAVRVIRFSQPFTNEPPQTVIWGQPLSDES